MSATHKDEDIHKATFKDTSSDYDAAVTQVARGVKTFLDAGLGGEVAAQMACDLWCHCNGVRPPEA